MGSRCSSTGGRRRVSVRRRAKPFSAVRAFSMLR